MAVEMVVNEAVPSQSSVQIESRAKGAPAITVKIYNPDPEVAAAEAMALFDRLTARYAALQVAS